MSFLPNRNSTDQFVALYVEYLLKRDQSKPRITLEQYITLKEEAVRDYGPKAISMLRPLMLEKS